MEVYSLKGPGPVGETLDSGGDPGHRFPRVEVDGCPDIRCGGECGEGRF